MSREFYNTFEEWFDEIENYATRGERFLDEFDNPEHQRRAIEWLRSAFECGQSGPQRQLDMLADSKRRGTHCRLRNILR